MNHFASDDPVPFAPVDQKSKRVLLVGCGGISKAWINACRSHLAGRVELAGFVDVRPAAAQARAAEVGGAWSGDSLTRALAEVRPDVVFNCTTP
jgi:predicted dehydrogenase